MKRLFEVKYASIPVDYVFRHKETPFYFGKHLGLSKFEKEYIQMSDDFFSLIRNNHPSEYSDDYVEYKGLLYLTATYLLRYHLSIFHSASFVWNKKAYLLAGESGVGKSTQFFNWMRLYPNEIKMISGDMPVLDFRENSIMVHPSPWNGKERIGNDISAPLGGIIFLKQGQGNILEKPELNLSIHTLFRQFCALPNTEEEIREVSYMVERIIKQIPLYTYTNDGSEDSTKTLRNKLLKEETDL